jgi:hypothetical protein
VEEEWKCFGRGGKREEREDSAEEEEEGKTKEGGREKEGEELEKEEEEVEMEDGRRLVLREARFAALVFRNFFNVLEGGFFSDAKAWNPPKEQLPTDGCPTREQTTPLPVWRQELSASLSVCKLENHLMSDEVAPCCAHTVSTDTKTSTTS